MRTPDIPATAHKLEESGMDRSRFETIANTIVAAMETLAAKIEFRRKFRQLEMKIDVAVEYLATIRKWSQRKSG